MRTLTSIVFLLALPALAAVAAPDIEVQKSTNNEFPIVNEPVEFTVQVSNIGDALAAGVIIIDQLPAEMEIPAGTAAFTSVGSYDPASGEWMIGDLDAGQGAVLVVPAIVVRLANRGPDAARNVVVTLLQNPVVGPDLRFDDMDCTNTPAAFCRITEIAAGETVTIDVTSDLYQNYNPSEQTLSVNATTSDVDYDISNNNSSALRLVKGFSSCEPIDFGVPGSFDIGPACFIATAAYGTPMHPHLDSLRDFRDRYLVTNAPGRVLVRFYYRYSPPIAGYIADRSSLRTIVRVLLAPIVFTIENPGLAALLFLGFIGAIWGWRRFLLQATPE